MLILRKLTVKTSKSLSLHYSWTRSFPLFAFGTRDVYSRSKKSMDAVVQNLQVKMVRTYVKMITVRRFI